MSVRPLTRLTVLCVLLLLAASSQTTSAGALDDVVIQDGARLTNNIFARSITLPAGSEATIANNIVLEATTLIRIEGQLSPSAGTAFDLTLHSDRDIVITGVVMTGGGAAGAAATELDAATGQAGNHGGDLTVEWGSLSSLTLAEGSHLRTGNGGAGGDGTITGMSNSSLGASAAGGAGGRGGNVLMRGGAATIYGTMHLGSGGNGGNAGSSATASSLSATGGPGGDSGSLVLPPPYTTTGLYNTGQLSGGLGGRGGDADASAPTPAAADGSCGADGSPSTDWRIRNGNYGCLGRSAVSNGAPGGYGALVGGDGGDAKASAGAGGMGGRGASGFRGFGVCNAYVYGGDGGYGGGGGNVEAYGGRGGDGRLMGGNGGDAVGNAGSGGTGGRGGDGGFSAAICAQWELDCSTNNPGQCWIGPNWQGYFNYGCGHAGNGGPGGSPSYRIIRHAGVGGTNAVGLRGSQGSSGGADGSIGLYGADGSYPDCNHAATFNHNNIY